MRSKKFIIGYAIAIFLIIFLITFNSVCSITQFDVRYDVGSESGKTLAVDVQKNLDGYLKKSFLFFDEKTVYDIVEEKGNGYLSVLSVKKVFPNKIKVSVRELYEEYAFATDDGYVVFDRDGVFIGLKKDTENNIGGTNVKISGFEFVADKNGVYSIKESDRDIFSELMRMCTYADECFEGVRKNIAEIEYIPSAVESLDRFVFTMREGMQICVTGVTDQKEKPYECFCAAVQKYLSLNDAQKLSGYILPVVNNEGKIVAEYSEGTLPTIEK